MEEAIEKVEKVLQRLDRLSDDLNDAYRTTPQILNAMHEFVYSGLDEIIQELGKVQDELAKIEEERGE